jgi:hypothetical protein
MLQDLETKVMLDTIGKALMQMNMAYLHVHYAILVNNDKDCDTVMQVMADAFQAEFGIVSANEVEA